MKKPTQCALWEHREPLLEPGKLKDLFGRIETYVDEDHLVRSLLKCRECGQLYFHEFYEWIDWEDGDDPQYSTYIPVETEDEIKTLKTASPLGLLNFSPRLQRDFPKDAEKPRVRWVGKQLASWNGRPSRDLVIKLKTERNENERMGQGFKGGGCGSALAYQSTEKGCWARAVHQSSDRSSEFHC